MLYEAPAMEFTNGRQNLTLPIFPFSKYTIQFRVHSNKFVAGKKNCVMPKKKAFDSIASILVQLFFICFFDPVAY